MVSKVTFSWIISDRRQARSNSFRFQFTITTVINRPCYQAASRDTVTKSH
jgi:hypothetical protein